VNSPHPLAVTQRSGLWKLKGLDHFTPETKSVLASPVAQAANPLPVPPPPASVGTTNLLDATAVAAFVTTGSSALYSGPVPSVSAHV